MKPLIALTICCLILSSCHKTVTPRKLDGEWTQTNSVETETNEFNSANSSNFQQTITTNDGTTTSITYNSSASETYLSNKIYTFDKKKGTYTEVEKTIKVFTDSKTIYTETNGYVGDYVQEDTQTTTKTRTGTFTITGGTGDIEKNTQVVLSKKSVNELIEHSYVYKTFDNIIVTDFTGKFVKFYPTFGNMGGELIPMASSKSETIVYTGELDKTLFTVTKLKKGVLEMESSKSETATAELGVNTNASSLKIVLTKKK